MLDDIEITTPRETFKRMRKAIKSGLKLWENARFVMTDVPLDKQEAQKILPLGMKLTESPTATVFVVNYQNTAFTVPYKEAAFLIHVRTPLGKGLHCCWMVVDDDTALILGRELLGYPKKMADIRFEEKGGDVKASVTRRGTRVLAMEAKRGQSQDFPLSLDEFNLGDMPGLEKLDLRWNKLSFLPEWIQRLEQRGCTVFK